MEKDNWIKIFSTHHMHKAIMVEDFLTANDIKAVTINKKDSSYNNFGNYEIFVGDSDKAAALSLLHEHISFQ